MNKEFLVKVSRTVTSSDFEIRIDENPRIRYVYLGDPIDSKIVNCLNVNGGELLVGLNSQRRINSIEMNIPRDYWKNLADSELHRPNHAIRSNIEFVNMGLTSERTKTFDLPLIIYVNEKLTSMKIEIGPFGRDNSGWLAISNNCLVELKEENLVGFWIDLVDQ